MTWGSLGRAAAGAAPWPRVLELAPYEVSLGDTLGRATPERIGAMLEAVLQVVPAGRLAGHFHDTAGRAVENVGVALDAGLRVFDAAVGGLGGCPFAPGAKGNVATEDVVMMCEQMGFRTGVAMAALLAAVELASTLTGHAQGGRAHYWLSNNAA